MLIHYFRTYTILVWPGSATVTESLIVDVKKYPICHTRKIHPHPYTGMGVIFLNGPIPASFYLFSSFQYSYQLMLIIIFADDWIRTADHWSRKRPLYWLSHSKCVGAANFFSSTFINCSLITLIDQWSEKIYYQSHNEKTSQGPRTCAYSLSRIQCKMV